MSSYIFSIIIPTLNEAEYLPDLLQDLQNQTVKNFEVIIIDGKSEDKTRIQALTFAKTLSIQFIESQKRNVSYQRNLGSHHARGEYLFFLDADTRIDPGTTEKIESYINKEHGLLYLPLPKTDKADVIHKFIFEISTKFVIFIQRFGKAFSFGPGIVIQRDLFEEIEKFDEKAYVSEDHNLIKKAYTKGIKARFLPDVRYVFSMRRGTMKIVIQYLIFVIMTLVKGVVYLSPIKYEMGGHNYKKKKDNFGSITSKSN